MARAKVAVYVQSAYAKPTYAVESYNVRAWPGLEMVCDALRRAGLEVDYCSAATVSRYKLVLVSITAGCDWYSFLAERVRWKANGLVVAGGPGILNVRPFLPYADVFCFGRAEAYVVPLIRALLRGGAYRHPSVCYSSEFNMRRRYRIDGGECVYPHEVTLANGKRWRETAIGCQRKCCFCGYTWHRRHVGGLQAESGAGNALWGGKASERTIFELDLADPESWDLGHLRMVGLDGFSERLRRVVNKPITRAMFQGFLRGLATARGHPAGKMKVYNVVGYPTEGPEDWKEFGEDLARVDAELPNSQQRWGIVLHSTPFKAVPATPAATWPMSYRNYRGLISRVLKQGRPHQGNLFFKGNKLWAVESKGTESLPTCILEALALRGTEDDTEIVARLGASRRFANARVARKVAMLEQHLDVAKLFRGYTWKDLPTRYLAPYAGKDVIQNIDAITRRRAGRRPWTEAADPT